MTPQDDKVTRPTIEEVTNLHLLLAHLRCHHQPQEEHFSTDLYLTPKMTPRDDKVTRPTIEEVTNLHLLLAHLRCHHQPQEEQFST